MRSKKTFSGTINASSTFFNDYDHANGNLDSNFHFSELFI